MPAQYPWPLAPTEPCSNARVLWGGSGSPHGVTEPHSGGGHVRGPPGHLLLPGHQRLRVSLEGFSRMRAAHPAGLLAPAPISAACAPGTPAQPSRLGNTSHFLFVYTVRLLPASGGGSACQGAGRPSLHGPAAPRRNLITLFSWFRFCFLIKKKMTPLGSGPRPCDVPCTTGVTLNAWPAGSSRPGLPGRAVEPRTGSVLRRLGGEAGVPTSPSCRLVSKAGTLPRLWPSNSRWAGQGEAWGPAYQDGTGGVPGTGPPQNPHSPPNGAPSTSCSWH